MTLEQVQEVARVAHEAAVTALNQPTRVVPLVTDERYKHKWVEVADQVLDEDEQIRTLEPVRAAAMHLAQAMLLEGVREFMPLALPDKAAVCARVDSDRLSLRIAYIWAPTPPQGDPGPRLQVAIAGLAS